MPLIYTIPVWQRIYTALYHAVSCDRTAVSTTLYLLRRAYTDWLQSAFVKQTTRARRYSYIAYSNASKQPAGRPTRCTQPEHVMVVGLGTAQTASKSIISRTTGHVSHRRLATGNVQCVCSATYQIFFLIFLGYRSRTLTLNPNPITNPNPKNKRKQNDTWLTWIKFNIDLYLKVNLIGHGLGL